MFKIRFYKNNFGTYDIVISNNRIKKIPVITDIILIYLWGICQTEVTIDSV